MREWHWIYRGGHWGFALFGWTNPEKCKDYYLIGLTGDSATGSVWLDLLFMTFTIIEEK